MQSYQNINTANKEYAILAIDNDKDPAKFKEFLKYNAIPHSECLGSYTHHEGELKGVQVVEKAYIIPAEFLFLLMIANAGWTDKQESVLHLGPAHGDGSRKATLLFGDQSTLALGYLSECTLEEAMASDSWTYNADLKKFFITREL